MITPYLTYLSYLTYLTYGGGDNDDNDDDVDADVDADDDDGDDDYHNVKSTITNLFPRNIKLKCLQANTLFIALIITMYMIITIIKNIMIFV